MTFCTFRQQNFAEGLWLLAIFHTPWVCQGCVENCQTIQKLHLVVCGNVQLFFLNFFRKLIFFKLNNFFKTSESTFPVKNWLFHIFPASEGSPFLTVILTVKLAGLPFLQAEEFTDNFQSDKSCQKYTFLLVLCFSGKSYLVIKVIKNVWLFTCSLRLSW